MATRLRTSGTTRGGDCPSELLPFTWADADFQNDTLLITSPKTAHLDKPYRTIPVEVFGDVKPCLEDLFELAQTQGKAKPTDYIITRYREPNTNLRTQFLRISKRAGIEPWGKLFQNCRASRETELIYLGYKIHEVCAWIGNSPAVANDHYLQVLNSTQKADLDRSASRRRRDAVQKCGATSWHKGDMSEHTSKSDQSKNPGKTRVFQGLESADQYARRDSNP